MIILGKALVEEGAQESTNVSVQTVAKNSKNKNGPALPIFNADPSKVTVKGMGIKKAFIGKQNQFTVNASDAGETFGYFHRIFIATNKIVPSSLSKVTAFYLLDYTIQKGHAKKSK